MEFAWEQFNPPLMRLRDLSRVPKVATGRYTAVRYIDKVASEPEIYVAVAEPIYLMRCYAKNFKTARRNNCDRSAYLKGAH